MKTESESSAARPKQSATVQIGQEGAWCVDNKNPQRWLPSEAVLVRYEPHDQFATIIDPETLEPL